MTARTRSRASRGFRSPGQRDLLRARDRGPFVQGEIDHSGSGLSLTGGGKTVELTDVVVDPRACLLTGKVSVDGTVAAESAPLFFLDGRTLQPLKTKGSEAVLEGTTVKPWAEAASLLNDTFATGALASGPVVGVANITVNTARPVASPEKRERPASRAFFMGDPGFEPGTSSLSEKRSNRLS